MDSEFEQVLRVDDWYDGVREGVALLRGVAHNFRWIGWELREWDADEDRYRVWPVGADASKSIIMRAEFRNSATAPDPQSPPMVPQEVRWSAVSGADAS